MNSHTHICILICTHLKSTFALDQRGIVLFFDTAYRTALGSLCESYSRVMKWRVSHTLPNVMGTVSRNFFLLHQASRRLLFCYTFVASIMQHNGSVMTSCFRLGVSTVKRDFTLLWPCRAVLSRRTSLIDLLSARTQG